MKKLQSIIARGLVAALLFTVWLPSTTAATVLTKTPTNLQPNDVSTLSQQLSAAASSMQVNPVKKWVNGTRTTGCFHTGSGFLLIQDSLGRYEYASFGSSTCSATYYTTLSNLRRGLSTTTASFTAGTGMAFDVGTSVKVVDYPIVYNNTVKKDLPNTLEGSGSILCGAVTQPCLINNGVTTAQRDAFTFGKLTGQYPMIFNTTTGTHQAWNGTQWLSFGSGAQVNASTSVAGRVLLGTIANQIAKNGTDINGSQTVVSTLHLTQSGSQHLPWNNSYQAGRVPILNASGALAASLGGLGKQAASGALLVGRGSGAVANLSPGANATYLRSNGTSAYWDAPKICEVVYSAVADSDTVGTSSTAEENLNKNYTIPANDMAIGTVYELEADLDLTNADGTLRMKIGNQGLTGLAIPNAGADTVVRGRFVVRTVSSSGAIMPRMEISESAGGTDVDIPTNSTAINMTTTNVFQLSWQSASNNAGYTVKTKNFTVTKCQAGST